MLWLNNMGKYLRKGHMRKPDGSIVTHEEYGKKRKRRIKRHKGFGTKRGFGPKPFKK